MTRSDFNVFYLPFLQSIDTDAAIPNGCDIRELATRGWVAGDGDRWAVTPEGQDVLKAWRIAEEPAGPDSILAELSDDATTYEAETPDPSFQPALEPPALPA